MVVFNLAGTENTIHSGTRRNIDLYVIFIEY